MLNHPIRDILTFHLPLFSLGAKKRYHDLRIVNEAITVSWLIKLI